MSVITSFTRTMSRLKHPSSHGAGRALSGIVLDQAKIAREKLKSAEEQVEFDRAMDVASGINTLKAIDLLTELLKKNPEDREFAMLLLRYIYHRQGPFVQIPLETVNALETAGMPIFAQNGPTKTTSTPIFFGEKIADKVGALEDTKYDTVKYESEKRTHQKTNFC